MPRREITKTQRILAVYHLMRCCEEVSMKELEDSLPGCKKTFSRDIALLRQAGVAIRYSGRRRAFVLDCEGFIPPELPAGKSERRYIEKIARLTEMMKNIPDEDCDQWYAETFPGISKRTMQRDFATLNSIGYRIKYVREYLVVPYDKPINRYYCLSEPNGIYGLDFT